MSSDIFSNLYCAGEKSNIVAIEKNEVTWIFYIVPSGLDKTSIMNLATIIDDVLIDFFSIGKVLEQKCNFERYTPMRYALDLRRDAREYLKGSRPNGPFRDSMLDRNCGFVLDEELIQHIVSFLAEYGMFWPHKLPHEVRNSLSDVIKDIHIPEIENSGASYNVVPISYIVNEFFDVYYKIAYPEEFQKAISSGVQRTHPSVHKGVKVNLTIYYSFKNGKWVEKKQVIDALDAITLFCINNKIKIVKTCPNCNSIFITSNEKSVYCSPECRNRANSKKSYYKKKGTEVPDHAKPQE